VTRLPVRARLTLAFAVVMAVLLAATGLFVRQQMRSNLDAEIDAALHSHAAAVAALALQSDTGLADARRGLLSGQGSQIAQIVDGSGRVIDASGGMPRHPLIDARTLSRARAHTVLVGRSVVAGDQPVRLLASPIQAQGQKLVAVVGQSLEARDRAIADLTGVLLVGGPVALLLASLAGYSLTGFALRPVEDMRRRERRFIADASHELRTPLTMLRTELELIARDEPSGPDLQAATASAIEETGRLGRLADDLLLLSRADHERLALHVAATSPAALVDAAADRGRRHPWVNGTRIVVARDAGAPFVRVDADRIGQAIDNMVDNALRHAASEVELATRVTGSKVEIHVLDDGPGFLPEFLPRAWERFSRADAGRTDDGAGLGMSIIRTIAELHGGSAGAANRPGGGADVWIAL
jgi:two-component system, OmpR family, sensor kinase